MNATTVMMLSNIIAQKVEMHCRLSMSVTRVALSVVCMMLSPFPVRHDAADQAPTVQAVELHAVVHVGRDGARHAEDDAALDSGVS